MRRAWRILGVVALVMAGEVAAIVYWPPGGRLGEDRWGAVFRGQAGEGKEAAGDWDNPLLPAYVGNDACQACHAGEAIRHARSGHSRTLVSRDLARRFTDLDGKTFQDDERGRAFVFRVIGEELLLACRTEAGEQRQAIQLAVGSGTHAITFLTLLDSPEGQPLALEHRVSLFGPERRLGMTPSHHGQPVKQPIEELGRLKHGEDVVTCIGCHTTTAQVRSGELADLREDVGCESCHGPGRRHVASLRANRQELEIAVTHRMATAAEEIQVCGRCHRHPDNLSMPPTKNDAKLARFQPVGILMSACYQKSEGRLRCSSCHDPHAPVERDASQYESRCLKCHDGTEPRLRPCSELLKRPSLPRVGCIGCHMPSVEVHPGISFHDHWIRPR